MIAFDDLGKYSELDTNINHLINSIQLVQSSMNNLINNELTLALSVQNLNDSVQ